MAALSTPETTEKSHLTLATKLIYGSGDWGRASFNTLRQIFYAIFLTDVVGLDPRLASVAAFVGIIWDATNDPLVGALSDNVRTRWGRRRPFLLLFSVPFALAFILLWWAPPWHTQFMLMIHCTLAYCVADTIQTLVTVPYLALTPELATGYDERTSLTSFRMFFNLIASLVTAVLAPTVVQSVVKSGFSIDQGYLTVAALFGGLAIIPSLLIFFFVHEREIDAEIQKDTLTFRQTLKNLWQNTPFRFATGIYVLNWVAFDIVALMIPFYLLYWVGKGDLLLKINILGINLSLVSAVLGILLLTATFAIPLWNWMAQKWSKRIAYIIGMIFWIVVQSFLLFIKQGDITLILVFSFLAGLSVSTAHVMPEALFPDVIDWDELRTDTRKEGMYYGAVNFIRKLSSAFAIFIALQTLGWFGYKSPPATATIYTQSSTTLMVIRLLTGPTIAIFLLSAIAMAWSYPLTRERQNRIRRMLQRRQERRAKRRAEKKQAGDGQIK
ncbi:MAG: glycoside-pentoside-hexuronide (GPH):cation symporter [Anaerolineaceae bacterium]|jgi:GPH family glycoside/pentoside/hexuronide:cation symporter